MGEYFVQLYDSSHFVFETHKRDDNLLRSVMNEHTVFLILDFQECLFVHTHLRVFSVI